MRTRPRLDSHILMVDDDPASLRLAEQLLVNAGYTNIHIYADPALAISELEPRDIDLAILDLQMPEIDGLSLFEELRRDLDEDDFLPVLVVTADSTTATRRRALALGADDFLTKPIDVVEMTLRVRHLLELRALHLALTESKQHLESEVVARTEELAGAMQRLENLIDAKDIFVASVSHELRTPLTAVLGFASALSERSADLTRDEVAEFARLISEQAMDLSSIIDDLLVAARSEINAVQVLREKVALGDELRAVVRALPDIDQSRIRVPAETVEIVGDHLRVRQIIRNLISNALKHGGPQIQVELSKENGHGAISVIDDGEEIPDETRARLFEPYFHGDDDAGKPPSIGLGLTVSRFLARLMEGDLDIDPGAEGTAFRLTLPVG